MYGRKYYDYSNATLIFRTPGESIKLDIDNMLAPKGRMLAFHPDLMAHTALGNHIGDYSFFFYKPNESLHLSSREKMKITECIRNIEEELRHAIDRHSKTLISRHIELLLDYCERFNERQFITRCEANKIILHKIHSLLSERIHLVRQAGRRCDAHRRILCRRSSLVTLLFPRPAQVRDRKKHARILSTDAAGHG